MCISIVEINLLPKGERVALKVSFGVTAPRYTDVPSLLRKYYTLGVKD